jgi:hypothetical protein
MGTPEAILNLWYVRDAEGIIYSLRAKVYASAGSDKEKLSFLQHRARLDYLIAEPFKIPARFHLTIENGQNRKKMAVAHISMFETLDSPIALFEDAIQTLEARFPAQSGISVSEDPLVCVTPLMQNSEGTIEPKVDRHSTF